MRPKLARQSCNATGKIAGMPCKLLLRPAWCARAVRLGRCAGDCAGWTGDFWGFQRPSRDVRGSVLV